MIKKDKHIKIPDTIIEVMDTYAEKTFRKKTVIYEMALRSYIDDKKEELIKAGVSEELIEKVFN